MSKYLAVLLLLSVIAQHGVAQEKRAKPPTFSDDQERIFFDDVSAVLVGPRPDFGQMAESIARANTSASRNDAATSSGERWSDWVSTDTVENEIKRQAQVIARVTQTATEFKGGGYRDARDSFSILALMFRLAGEHEDRARWRDIGPGLSTLMARAAANCKVGTDGSYREAAARAQDLADLVRGSRPDVPGSPPDQLWSDLADRSPIMKRMEVAQQNVLGPLISTSANFSRGSEEALHDAQVLAVLSEMLTREEFLDAGDEEYDSMARDLRDAATAISHAADQDDYQSARSALGQAGKSCSDCHDLYRG